MRALRDFNFASVRFIDLLADIDKAQLERKIRLLSLTTLAFQNVGRDLSYSVIADLLQVENSQVERWVIDGAWLSNSAAIHF